MISIAKWKFVYLMLVALGIFFIQGCGNDDGDGTPSIDTSALEAKIAEAEALIADNTAGTAEGQFPQSAFDDLQAAIDEAKSNMAQAASQEAVDALIQPLTDAIEAFKAAVVPELMTRYEAEDNTATAGTEVSTDNEGFSGTGYVDFGQLAGQDTIYVQWQDVEGDGDYKHLVFRYANGSTGDAAARKCLLLVNGEAVDSIDFVPTGGWTTYKSLSYGDSLPAGMNTVALAQLTADGPNLDRMDVLTPESFVEVEGVATFNDASQTSSENAGFTGSGYVDFNGLAGEAFMEVEVTAAAAGAYVLAFRYANASKPTRECNLIVNGSTITELPFEDSDIDADGDAGNDWTIYRFVSYQVDLNAGSNTVRLEQTHPDAGPNVDRLDVIALPSD